jgi:hypothetical protein
LQVGAHGFDLGAQVEQGFAGFVVVEQAGMACSGSQTVAASRAALRPDLENFIMSGAFTQIKETGQGADNSARRPVLCL